MKFLAILLVPFAFLLGGMTRGESPKRDDATAKEARGQRLFLQCQACHSITPNAPHKLGPNLHGIVGTKAATRTGYTYSAALSKSGIVWTDQNLDAWLEHTNATVPGSKMIFAGMPSKADREALIAYLKRTSRPAR
ncbi:MAG: cytochrome c-2 domain protein [Pseudomonadota bacterium]|jgi:cytochrome c